MTGAIDPVSQVLATIEMFENVQKAATQQQLSQNVRMVRVTHATAPGDDGKGHNVNVVV